MRRALVKSRREVLRLASCGLLGALATAQADGAETPGVKFKVLGENDRLDIGDRGKQIIEDAYKSGFELEKKHGGCARCAVAALQKSIEFVGEDKGLFRAASCLDGGATPRGIQSCGAFTGAGMVIGWICGNEQFGETRLCHRLIRQVYEQFEKEYGSVLCKDVKEKASRNCPEVVGKAAKWTAEVLLRQFTNYDEQ
jgi:C_GCAxxG_C_C family probable redox protein